MISFASSPALKASAWRRWRLCSRDASSSFRKSREFPPTCAASGCGIIVTPTVSSVRDGIAEMLRLRPQWPQMGLAGRQYAIEHLRWGRIAHSAWKEYDQLMSRSHRLTSDSRQVAV